MKFGIFKPKTKTEPIVLFALQYIAGDVYIIAVDSNGTKLEQGVILCINKDGTLTRSTSISPILGLSLDKKGKIKEIGDK